MFDRLGRVAATRERDAEVGVGLGVGRVEAQRLLQLRDGFVDAALQQQRASEVVPGLGALRDRLRNQAIALETADRAARLRHAQPRHGNRERGPLQAMDPADRRRRLDPLRPRRAADAERLTHRRLAHLPDEPVVVEVQQCRSGEQARQHAADGLVGDRRRQVVQCAVRRDEADVQAAEAPASAEQEARE